MNIKIGIAYHKACKFIKSDVYIPVQVGASRSTCDLGIQRDDEGSNISAENAYCSEMSATYWLWKNVKSDYKGLFHYRRFLTFQKQSSFKRLGQLSLYIASKLISPMVKDSRMQYFAFPNITIDENQAESMLVSFSSELEKDIKNNDIDLYCAGFIKQSTYTMRTHLQRAIGFWHTNYIEKLIEGLNPEFNKYFVETLKDNKFVGFNMIIAKDEVFDDYCKMMFGILEKYHEHMNEGVSASRVNVAMLRDSGYIAELVTDSYIRMIKNRGRKIKHLGCLNVDIELGGMSSKKQSIISKIKNRI